MITNTKTQQNKQTINTTHTKNIKQITINIKYLMKTQNTK